MVRPVDQQTAVFEASLTAVRRTRLFEGIVAQVRDLIRDGRLRPGQRLPAERELAEKFQVSRASLREAIRTLELEGLVVIRPGTGTFVSEEGFDAAMETLARRLLTEREALADVVELRLLLEPQIATLAAQRATQEDKERLDTILNEQEQQVLRGETGAAADAAFHTTVASASHNHALVRLSATLVDLLAPSRDETLQTPERSRRSLKSHRSILSAIQEGDAEGAREAMTEHIVSVDPGLSRAAQQP
ncbi:MAG: FadR/GntR family transcriptional regulator [Dehalococcoidia bacterium]